MTKPTFHYGVYVDSDIPTTGVIHNCTPEWLIEESMHNSIDLTCEECQSRDCVECDLYNECEIRHKDDCDNCDCVICLSGHTLLVGNWRKVNGLYEPDKTGEYSAIMGETYTQVVWSKYTRRCALCSPCYPGQGDLDTPGEFMCYDVPPDVYGSD